MLHVDLLIVGAGWNGLAIAKTYLEVHTTANVLVLDYAESIGGTWAAERIYPGLKTNNLVGSYEFSDYPLVPEEYGIASGQHIPGHVVHKYLCNVARECGIEDSIRLRTKVETITLLDDGSWQVDFSDQNGHGHAIASHLVLATGLTSEPFMPSFPGRDRFQGRLFHAKDFQANAKHMANAQSVVVIGGNKSAWDVCYSAVAHFGAQAHMVMRRSGGGPSWVWPALLPKSCYFSSLSALSSTRFVSWLDPSPFSPSGQTMRAFLHRSWIGRKLISLFWSRLDAAVVALNAYDSHVNTKGLQPWTSTYWMGNSLSIHNYDSNWFDLARDGKIKAHAAEVVSLSENTVHLSDGTSIDGVDTVVCCTGWKATPNIRFLPEGVAEQIGFPGNKMSNLDLEKEVRATLVKSTPALQQEPIRTLPSGLRPESLPRSLKEHNAEGSSPYRLYRFVVPYGKTFVERHNFAIIGAHITIHTAILSQAQALWITAFFDGKIPSLTANPDLDQIRRDTFLHTEFERMRRPPAAGGAGERYPDLVVDSIPYVDMLLSDLGLSYHRKKSRYQEVVWPYEVSDYRGLVREWKEMLAKKSASKNTT